MAKAAKGAVGKKKSKAKMQAAQKRLNRKKARGVGRPAGGRLAKKKVKGTTAKKLRPRGRPPKLVAAVKKSNPKHLSSSHTRASYRSLGSEGVKSSKSVLSGVNSAKAKKQQTSSASSDNRDAARKASRTAATVHAAVQTSTLPPTTSTQVSQSLKASGGKKTARSSSDELVKRHMPLVDSLARQLKAHVPRHVDLQDLRSEGYIGLIDASRRFDPKRGNKFETFARSRVHGAMIDWLRKLDLLPRSARDEVKKIEAAEQALAKELGRPADENEVAKYLEVSLEELQQKQITLSCRFVSIDGGQKGSESGSNSSFIMDLRDESTKDPVDSIQASIFWKNLRDAVERLPEKEKLVLSLITLEGLNLKEVGHILNYSPSTIRQTRERALNTLREFLKSAKIKEPIEGVPLEI